MALPLILGALGAAQSIYGLVKSFKKRPEYERPDEANAALAIAKAQSRVSKMPGQIAEEENVMLNAQNALNTVAGTPGAVNAASVIQANADSSLRKVNAAAESQRFQREQQYLNQLNQSAQYSDLEFQMNEFAPYKEAVSQGSSIFGGGMQNIGGALQLAQLLK